MTNEDWSKEPASPDASQVAFDYVKTSDFRVVWADGAIGGITPSGIVHFALYAERPAIPRRQVFEIVDEDGQQRLGSEVQEKRLSRDSVVREMPMDVFMTPMVAEQLATWLLSQVELTKSMSREKK